MNIRYLTGGALLPAGASTPAAGPAPKRKPGRLVACGVLAVMVVMALGVATAGSARAGYGTGSLCSLTDISVTKQPNETFYAYQVDCPGTPYGWFGGNAIATYQEIGSWNQQTLTAYEDLYSFSRSEYVLSVWTCSEDPWITPAIYPNESGFPNGHVCQLQSQRGGDDWTTDTNPPSPFGYSMCFNDPWGVSFEGCWSPDDLTVSGPSAAILRAWEKAQANTVDLPGARTWAA